MQPFVENIENLTLDNSNFRKVLFTGENSQLVLMALKPDEDIGMETHPDIDQFIRVEEGSGKAVLDGKEYKLENDTAVVIPAGTEHNIVNGSGGVMKLYTIYSPPEHAPETIHPTKEDALADEHHH
ncbi:cupin domain-containing protein [Patescibacteria group bacterium]